ncbi:hypothetical protein BH18ACI2_BH18ACI2_20360 [soil metagenome]
MYRFDTTTDERKTASAGHDLSVRLNWLTTALEESARHERRFRHPHEEQAMRLMRRPLSTPQAFASFGMLLGLLPPAAFFYRIFGEVIIETITAGKNLSVFWVVICLLMNFICCVVGRIAGRKLGILAERVESDSWHLFLLLTALLGFLWGAATGAADGVFFFGIGAILGAIYASPVGMLAFFIFMPLHRLLMRGGMIDARHFWPLACGIALTITVLILSPHVFPVLTAIPKTFR